MNSSNSNSDRGTLLRIFGPTLRQEKAILGQIFFALILISLTQSLFLLLIGPLFKALFSLGANPVVVMGSLMPRHFAEKFPTIAAISVPRSSLVRYLPLSIFLVAAAKGLASYVFQSKQELLSLHLGTHLRVRLFHSILALPYRRLIDRSPAAWMSVVMNDVNYLQSRVSDVFTALARDQCVVVSSLGALYFIHWPTAVVLSVLAVPLMLTTGRTGKRISRYAEGWQKALAGLAGVVLDLRRRFEFIRAQEGESFELQRFQSFNLAYYKMIKRSLLLRSSFAPGLEFLGFVFFALVIVSISHGYLGLNLQSGEILQFFAALGILLRPLKSIGEQLSRYHETKGILQQSIKTFSDVGLAHEEELGANLSTKSDALEIPPLTSFTVERLDLSFKEGFRLQAENLCLSPGKTIALIGPSGAGKSTLLKCFAGLVPPDVWDASVRWWDVRRASTLVSQKPFLFTATVRENLSYGLPGLALDDARLNEALRFVGLFDELVAMGYTLETPLDFLQTPLSGGQMQRLTLARSLLRPHPFLLLDEVTAAVDPIADERITRGLLDRARARQQGLLFVTHRLGQLSFFDEVWFCESGTVRIFNRFQDLERDPRIQKFLSETASSN